MTYIINPIWFYLMSVVDAARTLCIVGLFLSPIAFGACIAEASASYDEEEKIWKKRAKKIAVFAVVFLIGAIFIPSKETLMQIMIAKYATYENADSAIQAIKSAADYVIEAAGKLK